MANTKNSISGASARVSLADFAYLELKKALNKGRFEPGEYMREEAVAEWLQVSRTPVREALRRLASDNLLVNTNRGLAVPQLSQDQVFELYAMREVLEGAAAGLAAKHASPIEIELMHHLLRDEAAAKDNAEKLVAINKELHNCIYRAAKNRYLVRTLTSLQNGLEQLRGTTFAAPGRPPEALREHRAIVRAIQRQDSETAEKVTRQHVSGALTLRLRIMRAGT